MKQQKKHVKTRKKAIDLLDQQLITVIYQLEDE